MKPGNFQGTSYKKDTFCEGIHFVKVIQDKKEIRMKMENNFLKKNFSFVLILVLVT